MLLNNIYMNYQSVPEKLHVPVSAGKHGGWEGEVEPVRLAGRGGGPGREAGAGRRRVLVPEQIIRFWFCNLYS